MAASIVFSMIGSMVPTIGLPETGSDLTSVTALTLAFLFVPVTLGLAILRYRLWDIDLVINRALVYGALTGSLTVLYIAIVGGMGSLIQARGSLLLSLLAAGLVAVLFAPLRGRLQASVNRLMYGERDDPYRVLTRVGERVGAALAPEAALQAIAETLAHAMKSPYVAITLRQADTITPGVSHGTPGGELLCLPLEYQGETVGELLVAPRGPREEFSPADRHLLGDLARQIGPAAHAVRLTAELQRSRERLVLAREEERRRLRRDLHDGLGPVLASLFQRLDSAAGLVERDPKAAVALLGGLREQVKVTLGDIRRLVYALRPPALDEFGLVAAIREHAAQHEAADGLRVLVTAPDALPPLPAAVEVAAFRIALEALTNVVRHAHARTCHIRLELTDALQLEISDDGTGLPDSLRTGVGLTSMRERAAELGGQCRIEPDPAGGTRVCARLPVPKA
jgi:signal transduction histidine kinase